MRAVRTSGMALSCAKVAAPPCAGHLGVPVADRVRQCRRRPATAEQHQVGFGGGTPVPVVARQQDLVALGIDALDAELPAGHRHRLRQARTESAGHVLDDVRGQDVVEQLAPRRIGLREGDDHLLGPFHRLHTGDEVVAGRVDDAGLAHHLTPQVPVVVGADRGVVGPLRLGPDVVRDGEGFWLVTSADSSRVGSSSHREPVGAFVSAIGRNELGSTSAAIAALTGD